MMTIIESQSPDNKLMPQHSLTPHDDLFKASLQNIVVAKDFFNAHLPAKIKEQVNLESLRLCNNEFISPRFKKQFSDIIYTVQVQGHQSYLYILSEHQSSADELMAFRVLHYQCQILQQHLEQHEGVHLLPLVYGLVFYHGQPTPYPYSTQIKACFSDPSFAQQHLLSGFQLIDIGQIDDGEIKQHQSAAMMELLQKHARSRHAMAIFKEMRSILEAMLALDLTDQIAYNFQYLLSILNNDDVEQVLDELTESLPNNLKGEIMSVADQLRQQGVEKGRQETMEKVAINLLKKGHAVNFVAQMTGLPQSRVQSLANAHAA